MTFESPPILFRYRFVPFGTKFTLAAGARQSAKQGGPNELFENEIVTDVGGTCLGHGGETLPVIDHHFFRESGQYPSAAAAVLHNAGRIKDLANAICDRASTEASGDSTAPVWLVSHVNPDFDALSSLYLIRRIFDGSLESEGWEEFGIQPDGWYATREEIDWYQPKAARIPSPRRWAILVAAEAARTDNCRKARCPRERQLASVLCAAIERGRAYTQENHGGVEFFDEVRNQLTHGAAEGLDPFYDSVLEQSHLFRAELAMLDREVAAYERDLRRAHKLMVFVPEAKVPFAEWFPELAETQLLDARGEIQAKHLGSSVQGRRAVDGIFLRDPESLLFKNWVRNDTDNSSLSSGFAFTAVVYSNDRPTGSANTGDYFFALDPETAGRMHLYPVWARLQGAEVEALHLPVHKPLLDQLSADEEAAARTGGTQVRPTFEGRAGIQPGPPTLGFDDPWFDGQNFGCTIVPTPNRGTLIGPAGTAPDLSDDPVAQIVLAELTDTIFGKRILLQDFSENLEDADKSTPRCYTSMRKIPPVGLRGYRFISVELDPDANLRSNNLVHQIAVRLWRFLDDNRIGMPSKFEEKHVYRGEDWIGVWNERGIVIAYRPDAAWRAEELQLLYEKVCVLAHSMRRIIEDGQVRDKSADLIAQLERSDKLLAELALRRQQINLPENVLIRQFLEASRLDQSLSIVRDIHASAVDRVEVERMRKLAQSQEQTAGTMSKSLSTLVSLQQKLEYVEVGIVLVYAAELTHILAESFEFPHYYTGIGVIVCPLVAASAAYYWLIGSSDHEHQEHGHPTKPPARPIIATFLVLAVVITAFVGSGLLITWLQKNAATKSDIKTETKSDSQGATAH